MKKLIDCIEINPVISPVGCVIWLHGLGADGNDFAPVAHELAEHHGLPAMRYILPHAPFRPVTINNGYVMRAWYDILSLGMDQRIDHDGIKQSCAQIHALIAHQNTLGIPTKNIILAGFSQGAVIALSTGLQYQERLGGILALSGYLPYRAEDLKHFSSANHATPIFLGHGTQDDIVPAFFGKNAFQTLNETGHTVTWHEYPMTHSVCPAEIKDIAEWVKKIIR